MKIDQYLLFFTTLVVLLGLSSCRTDFERIRTSGDPEKILEKANEYYANEDYHKAQLLYEIIIPDFRGRPETEEIFFKYAYTHYQIGQYILASHYFKNFSNTFATSANREEADYMAAYSNYEQSPIFRLGQENTSKAIDGLQEFVNTYPSSGRVSNCNKLIDELRLKLETKAFHEAKLFYDLRQYQSALHAFENVLRDFPETSNAEEIRYLAVKSSDLLAKNSIYSKKEERYKVCLRNAELFKRRHPRSDYIKEVINTINDVEAKIKKLEDDRHKNQVSKRLAGS